MASPSPTGSSTSTSRFPRISIPIWKRRRQSQLPEDASGAPSSSPSPDVSPSSPRPHLDAPRHPRQRTRSGLSTFLTRHPDTEPEELHPSLTDSYPDADAINAFAEALLEDQGKQEPPTPGLSANSLGPSAWAKLGLPTLRSPPPSNSENAQSSLFQDTPDPALRPTQAQATAQQHHQHRRVGKISAASDFAPVRERTAQRGVRGSADTGRREGPMYAMLRWPLLTAIFVTIGLEFFAYVLTRQIVNLIEWLLAHRGRKGILRRQMRDAKTFDEWRATALELDEYMDHNKWKEEDASGLYDWILVKKVSHSLKTYREQNDVGELMAVLDLCCRNNFAGTESFRLYSETYYGTKNLVEEYLNQVEMGMKYVTDSQEVPPDQKRAFFRAVSKKLGKSGLALSGGGAFGYYHVGLVKALLDAKLLPTIVSGTSAGGLIAALTCTRTDEELAVLLVPELADRITACEESLTIWAKRAWRTGARFDPLLWAEKASFFTLGSLTFREAYERTGKTLNVSVIPAEKNSPVKLLNYLTAPRCVIWSALLASAAVPGLLPPVCLMSKTKKGEYVPWNWGHRFKDGSLRVDIPLQDLHSMFHVNYPIVSQVNPHVHLFFFAPKGMPGRPVAHRKGKGWRGGFILSASEHVLKLHLSLNFKIIRDLDLLPAILGTDWSGVFLQRFGGAVTIWPKTRFWDWVRILSDPDRAELARMIRVGQQATWPKLHMIENRIRLERAVEQGRKACRRALRAKARAAGARAGTGTGTGSAGSADVDANPRRSLGLQSRRSGEVGPEDEGHSPYPQQDSGTDLSAAPTPGIPVLSDTDTDGGSENLRIAAMRMTRGESTDGGPDAGTPGDSGIGRAAAQNDASARATGSGEDYFGPRRTRPGRNHSRVSTAALRQRLVAITGMTTPGGIDGDGAGSNHRAVLLTPASEGPGTPGELPRLSRERSLGMESDDDEEIASESSQTRNADGGLSGIAPLPGQKSHRRYFPSSLSLSFGSRAGKTRVPSVARSGSDPAEVDFGNVATQDAENESRTATAQAPSSHLPSRNGSRHRPFGGNGTRGSRRHGRTDGNHTHGHSGQEGAAADRHWADGRGALGAESPSEWGVARDLEDGMDRKRARAEADASTDSTGSSSASASGSDSGEDSDAEGVRM